MYGENVMSKVAEALGVELGEVFVVENSTDNNIDWFRLTIDGIEHFSPDHRGFVTIKGVKGDWCGANYMLGELLVGKRMRVRRKVEQKMLFE
jgi:hypothetical protein